MIHSAVAPAMSGYTVLPSGSVTGGEVAWIAMPIGGLALRLTITVITVCGSDAVMTQNTSSPGATGSPVGSGLHCPGCPGPTTASMPAPWSSPFASSVDAVPICGSELSK